MKHIQKFNEELEEDFGRTDRSDEPIRVTVKDLIEYLSRFDPETEVHLDKDGWNYKETGLKTIESTYLFDSFEDTLIINN